MIIGRKLLLSAGFHLDGWPRSFAADKKKTKAEEPPFHEDCHLEHQRRQSAYREPVPVAEGLRSRYRLPTGDQDGRRRLSAIRDRGARLSRRDAWAEGLALEEPTILAGDYNVIPEPHDCFDPKVWENDALFLPQTRQAFRQLEHLGFTDAVRATTDAVKLYSFWDYQAGAWQKNNGIRIDHLMLSPEAADRLTSAAIEKHVRAWEKPSDHVPVIAHFNF
jgi:exodeoxyribonuclease III